MVLAEWNSPQAHSLYQETSPLTHLSSDDPPAFLFYLASRNPKVWRGWPRVVTGEFLFERLQAMGIGTVCRFGDHYPKGDWQDQMFGDMLDFFIQRFHGL